MSDHTSILIIGGGAAGLAAAAAMARTGLGGISVTLLEQGPRVGKKLLATGNGRCNLSNRMAGPERYVSSAPEQLARMLETIRQADQLSFWEEAGLMLTEQEAGRIYPACLQASAVLDVCRAVIEEGGVKTRCESPVSALRREAEGFRVVLEDGSIWSAPMVILAAGGKAAPNLGATGAGFSMARSLGHKVTPLRPALVPLKSNAPQLKGLKGLRARCGVTLYRGEEQLCQEAGEVQFTDYGLSGIVMMDLSNRIGAQKGRFQVALDLFPQLEAGELAEFLRAKGERHPGQDASFLLTGVLKRQLGQAVLRSAGLQLEGRPLSTVTQGELERLTSKLKHWVIPLDGLQSWRHAQVTGGGVALGEVDPETFQSRLVPGLYLAGELLDAAGDCGGFNLHWAVGSGLVAGRQALAQAKKGNLF